MPTCKGCGKREIQETVSNNSKIPVSDISVCAACRKFYFRYREEAKYSPDTCTCNGDISTPNDCSYCRLRRCKAVFSKRKQLKSQRASSDKDEKRGVTGEFPCLVCGMASNGIHFGVISCEACKSFFRRSIKSNGKLSKTYECLSQNESSSSAFPCSKSSTCRKCRFERCIEAGMAHEAISTERPSNGRKDENRQKLKSLSSTSMFSITAESCKWLTEESVKASAYLKDILAIAVTFRPTMTLQEVFEMDMKSFEVQLTTVGRFVNKLPHVTEFLCLNDRKALFSHSIVVIMVAQCSLNFDIERQKPFFFGVTDETSMDVVRSVYSNCDDFEQFMVYAGNAMLRTIKNIQEFALFCALLFLYPDCPALERPDHVSRLRALYVQALVESIQAPGTDSEGKLSEIFKMLSEYRKGTEMFNASYVQICHEMPEFVNAMTPIIWEIVAYHTT